MRPLVRVFVRMLAITIWPLAIALGFLEERAADAMILLLIIMVLRVIFILFEERRLRSCFDKDNLSITATTLSFSGSHTVLALRSSNGSTGEIWLETLERSPDLEQIRWNTPLIEEP